MKRPAHARRRLSNAIPREPTMLLECAWLPQGVLLQIHRLLVAGLLGSGPFESEPGLGWASCVW